MGVKGRASMQFRDTTAWPLLPLLYLSLSPRLSLVFVIMRFALPQEQIAETEAVFDTVVFNDKIQSVRGPVIQRQGISGGPGLQIKEPGTQRVPPQIWNFIILVPHGAGTMASPLGFSCSV